MSYYQVKPGSFYNNPPDPYGPGGDFGAPVPGWGSLPRAAGPARIGVGAAAGASVLTQQAIHELMRTAPRMPTPSDDSSLPPGEGDADPVEGGIPWWSPLAAAGVIAGGAVVAYSLGWLDP